MKLSEMSPEQKVRALAELDGYTFQLIRSLIEQGKYLRGPNQSDGILGLWITVHPDGHFVCTHDEQFSAYGLPNYLTSYDDIIRLVIRLGLWNVVMRDNNYNPTPQQICDTLIIVTGKAEL